jgi:hypothetical protein
MQEPRLLHSPGSTSAGATPTSAELGKRFSASFLVHTGVILLVLLIGIVVLGACSDDEAETIAATATPESTAIPTPEPEQPATPAPEATPTPEPAPESDEIPVAGEVMFRSDMTDWDQDQDGRFVEDGTYHLRVGLQDEHGDTSYGIWTLGPDEDFANVRVDVDLRLVTEIDPDGYGCLMLRWVFDWLEDWVHAYVFFCMYGDGTTEAGFQPSVSEEPEILLPRESRDAGSDPSVWTTLSVVASADELWFLINDQLVGTTTHSVSPEGGIGVSVFNETADLTEFEFTNAMVRALETSATEMPTSTSTATTVTTDLLEAVEQGLVTVEASGDGLQWIDVTITSRSESPLEVMIPIGTVFVSQAPTVQDMVVTREETILLSVGESVVSSLLVACMNMELDAPCESDTLEISQTSPPDDLVKLLALPDFSSEPFRIQQFAVWTITENPESAAAYRGLTIGLGPFGSGPDEDELRQIRSLFEQGGIEPILYPVLADLNEQ